MKILTIIAMFFAFSITAHAKLRIGDEFILKKHFQNIMEIYNHDHRLIDGVKVSKFFQLLNEEDNEKYECQIGFYRNAQTFKADYIPGTRFEVSYIKRNTTFDIIDFPFDYDYKGTLAFDLKELGKDTNEVTAVWCITRKWYGNKYVALFNVADPEKIMESLEFLYEKI